MKGLITGNIVEDNAMKDLQMIEELINSTVRDKNHYYVERILNVSESVILRLPA